MGKTDGRRIRQETGVERKRQKDKQRKTDPERQKRERET